MTMSASLSIRPWRFEHTEQPPVIDLLDRVNRERGLFRDVLDASLQEEVATVGALQLSDSEDEQEDADAPSEDGGVLRPSTREELYRAKFDMLQKVSLAHNEVMMALDFISLLQSKDAAVGRQTMSQFLKENIPAGTIGTDVWQRMSKDAAREAQDASLAHNVRMEALQKSADSILGAAKTLEDNVRKETRYWNEILSVTEAGWNVCRVPGQRHKLGVRFGLSESSPEFSRGGIATLTADDDGAISLDRGLEVRSRAVRVTILQGQKVVGCSKPVTVAEEALLESHIKQARDALFDEELFRELERESRSIASTGVRITGNAIRIPLLDGDNPTTIRFELIPRSEAAFETDGSSQQMNHLAHAVLCTAKLLLCQAHRDQLKRRSAIPTPMSEARKERPLMRITRPLLALSLHRHSIQVLNDRLEALARVLQHAGVEVKVQQSQFASTLPNEVQSAEALITNLLTPRVNEAELELQVPGDLPPRRVAIRIETSVVECTTSFALTTSDGRRQQATDITQAVWELESILANQLARALAAASKHDWYVDNVDAYLAREGLGVTGVREIRVEIDGQANALRLISPSFEKQWTLDQEPDSGLWQVWETLV